MTKSTASKSVAVDTFALSRGYATKAHAKRARDAFAINQKLSPDEFDIEKIDELHHYRRTRIGVAKPTISVTRDEAVAVASSTKSLPNAFDKITTGPTSPAPKLTPEDCKLAINAAIGKAVDGIPDCLKISPADRKASWAAQPPRSSKIDTTKPSPEMDDAMRKQISAANKSAASKKPKSKRPARIDWAAAAVAAKSGTLPPIPDFHANTHKYYRPHLEAFVKLAKAGDLKGLQNYPKKFATEPYCSSRTPMLNYRDCAMTALKAKAKA